VIVTNRIDKNEINKYEFSIQALNEMIFVVLHLFHEMVLWHDVKKITGMASSRHSGYSVLNQF
jgi:hypothetical protein